MSKKAYILRQKLSQVSRIHKPSSFLKGLHFHYLLSKIKGKSWGPVHYPFTHMHCIESALHWGCLYVQALVLRTIRQSRKLSVLSRSVFSNPVFANMSRRTSSCLPDCVKVAPMSKVQLHLCRGCRPRPLRRCRTRSRRWPARCTPYCPRSSPSAWGWTRD